jgi:RNA polymerase sigma factor (sigma-70 family)
MSDHEVSRFLRESSARLAHALQRRFAGHASGEDAVQEALIRAWQLTADGNAIGSWNRWIAVTATNVARMQLRSRQAEDRALTRLSAQTPTAHWPEPFQHLGPVADALERLPARQRQVLTLHYFADLSVRQIADALGISAGSVKSALHDGRLSLSRSLDARQRPRKRRTSMTAETPWRMTGTHPHQYELGPVPGEEHEGLPVVSLRCTARRADGFGTMIQTFRADDFIGKRMRLSGALRARNVDGRLGLWMRVDGPDDAPLAFDNSDGRPIRGTTDWERGHVVLDVGDDATAIALGVLLIGRGEGHAAGLRFEAVSRDTPVTDMSATDRLPAGPVDLDFAVLARAES